MRQPYNLGIYYRPLFVIIRLEAVWGVRIAYARSATRCLKRIIKKFPKLPHYDYEPSYTGTSGHEASLISFSIDNSLDKPELEGPYPDW